MKYTVDWSPQARAGLAAIWVPSSHRRAITEAQAKIDRLLATDPLGNGTFLTEGLYVLVVEPLRVLFEFSNGGRLVKVVSVGVIS